MSSFVPDDLSTDEGLSDLHKQVAGMQSVRDRALEEGNHDAAGAATMVVDELTAQIGTVEADAPSD